MTGWGLKSKPISPSAFTLHELGALYTAMDFILTLGSKEIANMDPDAHMKGMKIMDKVRDHFIAAGGDPKELEDPA